MNQSNIYYRYYQINRTIHSKVYTSTCNQTMFKVIDLLSSSVYDITADYFNKTRSIFDPIINIHIHVTYNIPSSNYIHILNTLKSI